MTGSGIGMIVLSALVIVQQYFNKWRALAAGIAVSGYSFGSLIAGPFVGALIVAYTWRGTLVIIAGIFLQVIVFGSLLRPLGPQHSIESISANANIREAAQAESSVSRTSEDVELQTAKHVQSRQTSSSAGQRDADFRKRFTFTHCCGVCRNIVLSAFDFSLLCNVNFSLYIVSVFCVHLGMATFLQHTPSRAAHYHIDRTLIPLLPMITGISVGISRIVFGFVANAPRFIDRMLQFGVTAALGGAVQMTTALATTFELMSVYCVIQGICCGKSIIFTFIHTLLHV